MSHSFKINLTTDPSTVLAKVKSEVIAAGGKFLGDTTCGEFSGSGVQGSYHISGLTVTVQILKKPFIATVKYVESKIRSYFEIL